MDYSSGPLFSASKTSIETSVADVMSVLRIVDIANGQYDSGALVNTNTDDHADEELESTESDSSE